MIKNLKKIWNLLKGKCACGGNFYWDEIMPGKISCDKCGKLE